MNKTVFVLSIATAILMSGVATMSLAKAAEALKGAAEEQDVI